MRNRLTNCLAAALLGAGSGVLAAPSSLVAWDTETMNLLEDADAEAGRAKAEEINCARCHGDRGFSDKAGQPSIAGQRMTYAYKQLRDYRDGTRENRRMARYVEGLSDQDLANLAAWYSGLPGPVLQATPAAATEVQELVSRGDGQRLIPACAACHGTSGEGSRIGVPALAGQELDYLIETMYAYKDGERANDVYGVMRYISVALTDAEVEALAEYYAALAVYPGADEAQ
ncbi:MAG: c-type cytochrome [Gammaproteobacteria bacterium]|jgi:cytochrome c553